MVLNAEGALGVGAKKRGRGTARDHEKIGLLNG